VECRYCGAQVVHSFLDLGFAPPSNAFLKASDLSKPELYYPLKIKVCNVCWLVQTEDYAEASELFSDDYAYFSGISSSWLRHAADYVKKIIAQLRLNKDSFVIEVASNDGYLLKNFVAEGIPCLGIEPTASTAVAARRLRVPVLQEFFGKDVASQLFKNGQQADLIIGNNVYAHVPDINDFTHGLKIALKPGGTITLEFPHLMQLIENTQFDTVYHEHFSYLSLNTVTKIFNSAGLRVWNVEELSTHGGSLRVFGCHKDDSRSTTAAVENLLAHEIERGLQVISTYTSFQTKANQIKDDLLDFLIQQKRKGKIVAAYGAAAKGNTLLNFAGVKPDLVSCVYDQAESKQGKFTPGSHIPIMAPDNISNSRIDYLLILPWNITSEVKEQNTTLAKSGVKFVTAIPCLQIHK